MFSLSIKTPPNFLKFFAPLVLFFVEDNIGGNYREFWEELILINTQIKITLIEISVITKLLVKKIFTPSLTLYD